MAPRAGVCQEFQIPNGELIHPQIIFLGNFLDRGDMAQMGMFGFFQVMEYGTCCYYSFVHLVNSKSFEGMGMKMFQQGFSGKIFIKYPALQGVGVKPGSKLLFKMFLKAALEYDFGRSQGLQQLVHILMVPFGNKKFPGGYVQKRDACLVLMNVDGCKKIVAGMLEQLIMGRNSWGDHLRYSAFYKTFCCLSVFHL